MDKDEADELVDGHEGYQLLDQLSISSKHTSKRCQAFNSTRSPSTIVIKSSIKNLSKLRKSKITSAAKKRHLHILI